MTALVVDGISGSGKTTLLRNLQSLANDVCPNFTKFHVTEHLTERFFENTSPTVADVHEHVARILRALRDLQELQQLGPFSSNPRVVTITIERLFLTFASRNLLTVDFFTEHSDLVKALELKSLLLVVPNELIGDRIAASMQHRNRGWTDYISRMGGLSGAIVHFQRQQDAMLRANDAIATYVQVQTLTITNSDQLVGRDIMEQYLWQSDPAC